MMASSISHIRRRTFVALALVLLGASCNDKGGAQENSFKGEVRRYVAHHAPADIVIDGRLDEKEWSTSTATKAFVDIRGEAFPSPAWRTTVRMLWDAEFFYVAAELEEPHLWATLTERDAIVYRDNDFEVFIDPDGDGRSYYEFEVNAFGTMFDLYLDRPYREGGHAAIGWDAPGSKWAVDLDGTLNDPSDRDRGWRVEMAVPWTDLVPPGSPRTGAPPKPGDTWRINFSRVQWALRTVDGRYMKEERADDADGHPEENWVWSPQGVIDMHIPSRWGRVTFEAPVGTGGEG